MSLLFETDIEGLLYEALGALTDGESVDPEWVEYAIRQLQKRKDEERKLLKEKHEVAQALAFCVSASKMKEDEEEGTSLARVYAVVVGWEDCLEDSVKELTGLGTEELTYLRYLNDLFYSGLPKFDDPQFWDKSVVTSDKDVAFAERAKLFAMNTRTDAQNARLVELEEKISNDELAEVFGGSDA